MLCYVLFVNSVIEVVVCIVDGCIELMLCDWMSGVMCIECFDVFVFVIGYCCDMYLVLFEGFVLYLGDVFMCGDVMCDYLFVMFEYFVLCIYL